MRTISAGKRAKKYCRDCKWSSYLGSDEGGEIEAFYQCAHPSLGSVSLVTGKVTNQTRICTYARKQGNFCGPKAIRFEERNSP